MARVAGFRVRVRKTIEYIEDPDVTALEAYAHVYLWLRFEYALYLRNRYSKKAIKFGQKLNDNLDVVAFRKEMNRI